MSGAARRRALGGLGAAALLAGAGAGCGGGDGDGTRAAAAATSTEPGTAAAPRKADCPMSAAAAREVYELLGRTGRDGSGTALVFRHEPPPDGKEVLTVTAPGPNPGRHVFLAANDHPNQTLGVVGRSGGGRVTLTAAPGCGAIDSLPDEGPYRATFTLDGRDVGSVRPGG